MQTLSHPIHLESLQALAPNHGIVLTNAYNKEKQVSLMTSSGNWTQQLEGVPSLLSAPAENTMASVVPSSRIR